MSFSRHQGKIEEASRACRGYHWKMMLRVNIEFSDTFHGSFLYQSIRIFNKIPTVVFLRQTVENYLCYFTITVANRHSHQNWPILGKKKNGPRLVHIPAVPRIAVNSRCALKMVIPNSECFSYDSRFCSMSLVTTLTGRN